MRQKNYLNKHHLIRLTWYDYSDSDYTRFHAHQGMEMLYIHQGQGQVITGQQVFSVMPNTLFIFQPFQLHNVSIKASKECPYIRTVIQFEPSVFEQYLKPFPNLSLFFYSLWKERRIEEIALQLPEQDTKQLLDAHIQRFSADKPNEFADEYAFFVLAFFHYIQPFWRNQTKDLGVTGLDGLTPVEKIMQWIEAHYQEQFELKKLAAHIHMSPNHVSYMFHEAAGVTLTEYLVARRIQQAKSLLSSTSLPIQEVGHEVGWNSSSYFCSILRKNVGMSPRQYRHKTRTRLAEAEAEEKR